MFKNPHPKPNNGFQNFSKPNNPKNFGKNPNTPNQRPMFPTPKNQHPQKNFRPQPSNNIQSNRNIKQNNSLRIDPNRPASSKMPYGQNPTPNINNPRPPFPPNQQMRFKQNQYGTPYQNRNGHGR